MRNRFFTIILLLAFVAGAYAEVQGLANALKEDYWREMVSRQNVDPEVRLIWYDSLLNIAEGDKTDIELRKIGLMRAAGHTDKALEIVDSLLKREKTLSDRQLLSVLFTQSNCLSDKRDYIRAVAGFNRVIATPKADTLKSWDIKAALGLFGVYEDLNDKVKAKEWLNKMEEMVASYPLPGKFREDAEGRIHGSRASLLISDNQLDSAYKEVKIAREMSSDDESRRVSLIQTAQIYIKKGQTEAAKDYIRQALRYNLDGQGRRTALYMLAQCHVMEKDYQQAVSVLMSYPQETLKVNSMVNQRAYYVLRAQAYAGLGDMEEAYKSLDSAISTSDTMIELMTGHQTNNAEEYLRINNEIAYIKDSLKRYKNLSAILFCLLLLSAGALLSILCFYMTLRKRMRNQQKTVMRARMSLQENMLDRSKNKENEDNLNRQQTTLLLRLAHLESVLDSMKNKLASGDIDKQTRDVMLRQLQEINGKEKMWELFSMQFEITNREFMNLLSQRHPELSKSEKRLCAFMLINLSTKEIANLLLRSPRTVDVTKYNIRKKLGVEMPTEVYLRQLAEEASRISV